MQTLDFCLPPAKFADGCLPAQDVVTDSGPLISLLHWLCASLQCIDFNWRTFRSGETCILPCLRLRIHCIAFSKHG